MENLHLKNLNLDKLKNQYNKNHKKTIPSHITTAMSHVFVNQTLPSITSYDKKLDDIVKDRLIYPTTKSKIVDSLKTFVMFILTTAVLSVVLYVFWEYIAKNIIDIVSKLINAI